ncbi:MAG: hypothetical protein WD048_06065 [Chitinophagales bacterium]
MLDLQKNFFEKNKILENASQTLKREFVGLDQIIDEVIDNISSWFTLHQMQERPLVINLWGLTGTGKTSLINRLAELLDYDDYYYRFDLGVKDYALSFRHALADLCENKEDMPLIIALDEFQHTRTLEGETRKEVQEDKNRMVWELIDSGKVRYIDWNSGLWSFERMIKKLTHLERHGVEAENAMVTRGKKEYCHEMDFDYSPNKKFHFFPENYYSDIIEYAGDELNLHLRSEVEAHFKQLNAAETIAYLQKVWRIAQKPSVKSFSKSVIFVLGNIDEAYTMSGNYSADIDADEFHELSLKINVPKIKQALRNRFRDEQIARLGNIHIIYPALNSAAYNQIILLQLKQTAEKLGNYLSTEIEFDKSLIKTIYDEGVYPTQGVRPLFTTINHILKSKLNKFIMELLQLDKDIEKLQFFVNEGSLYCNYFSNNEIIKTKGDKIIFNLTKLRKNRKDEVQAITAVHESGHAILSAILLKKLPEIVCSVTTDANNDGFVYSRHKNEYLAKNEVQNRVAISLGGLLAEELIFGAEYITAGAKSDILNITNLLIALYKQEGFGQFPIAYAVNELDSSVYHNIASVEEEVKEMVNQGRKLAMELLQKEKKLLLVLSDYLANHTCIKKEDLKKMLHTHALSNLDGLEQENEFYRNKLNAQVRESLFENGAGVYKGVCLNKDKG